MTTTISEELKNNAKALIEKIGPLAKNDRLSPEERRLYGLSVRMAKMVLDGDLESKTARRRYNDLKLMVDGLTTSFTLLSEADLEEARKGGSSIPGLDAFFCLASCVAAKNKCEGRTSDSNDFDIPESDSPEGDLDIDHPILNCMIQFISCKNSCGFS